MLKTIKSTCLVLLLVVAAYEVTLFVWSTIAEHKAEKLAEVLATLKPGYTTKGDAIVLFQARKWNVRELSHACSPPKGSCDALAVGASNFPSIIPLRLGQLAGITLLPLPPVRTAYFQVNLYFIDGILDSINSVYGVGATHVCYSRGASGHNFRSSEWKYEDGGMVASIGVGSSGAAFDIPFPRFAFNYMYSVKCVDARTLWPTAPPPTKEFFGWSGCREKN